MAEPFKNLIDADGVRLAARHLQRAWPAFDARRFVDLATHGLGALELKARVLQIAAALEATLPAPFEQAATLVERALVPLQDEPTQAASPEQGLAGWILWPVGEFVALRGIDEPERALQVLHALTQRFSAEFAIRPFIAAHPQQTLRTLARWAHDPSPRVRRLVSEGSRPRLPWGMRLQALVTDPRPTLPLLEVLQDDPDEAVRRSVANHLNDIAKDHPALVVQWLDRYLPQAGAERRALLRHACRSLIKQGHPEVLHAWGVGVAFAGQARVALAPRRLRVGETLEIAVTLRSSAPAAQRLVVDYAVHHVKASGATSPKVFKGWQFELAPGAKVSLTRRHSMRRVTTRRYHPGRHCVELRINGAPVAQAAFELLAEAP